MNLKVRNQIALAAVGALACSMAVAPFAAADIDDDGADLPGIVEPNPIEADAFRVAGPSRFDTAVEASKQLYPGGELNPFDGDTVIIANFNSWSDTLAATPLADALDAPVLYSRWKELTAPTVEELQRLKGLGFTNVVLVGGSLALHQDVVDEIEMIRADDDDDSEEAFGVDRVSGQTRYDTALMLAAEAVDLYQDDNRDLAPLRQVIVDYDAAQAEFDMALDEWEAAREATADAFMAQQEAQADATAAQDALETLTDQLEVVPDVEDVIIDDVDGNSTTVTSINEFNSLLAGYENEASDLGVWAAFVNDRIAEYRDDDDNDDDDGDVSWSELEAYFGETEFTLSFSDGDVTQGFDEFSDDLQDAFSDTFDGSDPDLDTVSTAVSDAKEAADAAADEVRNRYTDYVTALMDAAAADAANEALQDDINEAVAAYNEAREAQEDATTVYNEAVDAETEARNAVDDAFDDLGSPVERVEAQEAYDDALDAILDDADDYPAFLATGLKFPDALAAGPAASDNEGVVLLTRGEQMVDATQSYLDSGAETVAVGGPAARAVGDADEEYVGYSRYETASLLAAGYFEDTEYVGLASGEVAADAVVGGSLLANVDGTLVLTRASQLSTYTASTLSDDLTQASQLVILGGTLAIPQPVADAALEALNN